MCGKKEHFDAEKSDLVTRKTRVTNMKCDVNEMSSI